ncbi:GNAT family N-acetyltransferase [Caproicibacter sp.]|uniref:GNAT family N-acetyltransferase n=1 Tax=Caproicibacter sp. TaxID=2814884 RepID=UPI003989D423
MKLVASLDVDLPERYSEEIRSKRPPFHRSNGLEEVVPYENNAPAACGAIRILDGETVEIKRILVRADCRRNGHARRVITELEDLARARGEDRLAWKTGISQPKAVSLCQPWVSGFSGVWPLYRQARQYLHGKRFVLNRWRRNPVGRAFP